MTCLNRITHAVATFNAWFWAPYSNESNFRLPSIRCGLPTCIYLLYYSRLLISLQKYLCIYIFCLVTVFAGFRTTRTKLWMCLRDAYQFRIYTKWNACGFAFRSYPVVCSFLCASTGPANFFESRGFQSSTTPGQLTSPAWITFVILFSLFRTHGCSTPWNNFFPRHCLSFNCHHFVHLECPRIWLMSGATSSTAGHLTNQATFSVTGCGYFGWIICQTRSLRECLEFYISDYLEDVSNDN